MAPDLTRPTTSRDRLGGVRLAFGLLTVLPAGDVAVDRPRASHAMLAAPLVGVVLGAAAAAVGALAAALGLGGMAAAVLMVATLAALTRGLHLDGLADTADGLGSGPAPSRALAVMRAPDIGPFGVVTVVLVLLAQVSAMSELGPPGSWTTVAAIVVATATGRLAVCCACVRGVRPARPDGLGSLVAGTVRPLAAVAACLVVVFAAGLGGAWSGLGVVRAMAAVLFGLAGALVLLRHVCRRLGGVTGDVLGAMVEVATAVTLLVCAVG